jgi:hypothetical protein
MSLDALYRSLDEFGRLDPLLLQELTSTPPEMTRYTVEVFCAIANFQPKSKVNGSLVTGRREFPPAERLARFSTSRPDMRVEGKSSRSAPHRAVSAGSVRILMAR